MRDYETMPTLFTGLPEADPTLSWDDYATIIGILNFHFDNEDRPEEARMDARGSLDFLNNLLSHRSDDTLNARERAMLIRGSLLEGSSQDESFFTDQPEGTDNIHSAGHSIISDILKDFNLLKRNEIRHGHIDFEALAGNSQSEMSELHSTKPDIFDDTSSPTP